MNLTYNCSRFIVSLHVVNAMTKSNFKKEKFYFILYSQFNNLSLKTINTRSESRDHGGTLITGLDSGSLSGSWSASFIIQPRDVAHIPTVN